MNPVYLLDTNVISEFSKPIPNMHLLEKARMREDICAISSTVWQETVRGYESMPEGKRKQKIFTYIQKIKELYTIIPYDSFAAQICGELQARCTKNGKTLARYASQIAATAIANGMVLITHNTADYEALCENSMLKIEDWWEE